jgi:hypothetical protein
MRTIVCRFKDGEELTRHLIYDGKDLDGPRAIAFLGGFSGTPNEPLKLLVVVEGCEERCSVRVRLWERGARSARATCFGEIDPRDRVWVELLSRKTQAHSRFVVPMAS